MFALSTTMRSSVICSAAAASAGLVIWYICRSKSLAAMEKLWQQAAELNSAEVNRYKRQIILPALGIERQQRIRRAKVLVVGAGGIGCPAAMYLAAGGIGTLGIADDDKVALSNLHRQVGHPLRRLDAPKAASLAQTCKDMAGDLVNIVTYHKRVTALDADLVADFDVVIDATDNAQSRYGINDACVLAKKPLIAASAVTFGAQLCVYVRQSSDINTSPCLRCVFPNNAPSCEGACDMAGVLGPIPGTIGVLAAVEALKIAAGLHHAVLSTMLLFDALDPVTPFRTMKLKEAKDSCWCRNPTPPEPQSSAPVDAYPAIPDEWTVTAEWLEHALQGPNPPCILDCRPAAHFAVSHLTGSHNWPMSQIKTATEYDTRFEATEDVIVVCRRGNDSRAACLAVRKLGLRAKHLHGGLTAIRKGSVALC